MDIKENREIRKSAQDVINQLSVILRTAQIHDPNNIAVTLAIERFLALINQLAELEQNVKLDLIGEFFYINDIRVRYSLEYLLNFDFIIREFRKRELGSVIFKGSIDFKDMQLFLKAFIAGGFSDEPYETMLEGIDESKDIEIDRLKKIREGADVDTRKVIKKIYYNAVSYSKGVMNKIKAGEKVNIKKAKRIVETMVDQILEEEKLLLGMTAIKDYDEYTYHHSVNVSILSIALGQRLGLSKKMLTELGLVALFHDIGKIEIPNEVLNKATNFTDDEWKLIKKHPLWGLKAILRLKGLESSSIRSSIVAFEHHMNYDFSGYPKVRKNTELDLFSRIVSLADQYDAMTSSRVYSRIPLAPDKALSIMMERAGSQLDPLLFKFFVNMVGVFPIGTLVMLDTRELGLVYEANVLFAERPRILIIIDSKGQRVHGPTVDLTEKDAAGKFYRTIIKTLDPNKYKINLAEYLL
ncbi:MAG: HD-GYP domain-containing protein [Nitrospirae bacterium]|jgi:HD-GYP domain-containing protein (c-di-GMP phosphodiesterase class II)|nr:HD-GYP domain-containing protein [Nitrospirota bacterium]